MTRGRPAGGNMLGLVCLVMGLIIGVIMLGLTFNAFMFSRTRAQYEADAVAMALAGKINAGDRVGQMNELVEASRELVYESRDNANACSQQDLSGFAGLYGQLADEARRGQSLVEKERLNQIELITREIQQEAIKFNASRDCVRPFAMPWLRTSEPRIEQVDLGSVRNVQSSVSSLDGFEELAWRDQNSRLVDGASRLFGGNLNAKLATEDRDLDFKFSSLPAAVEGTVSPARNLSPEAFVGSASVIVGGADTHNLPQHIPSAVQIGCSVDAEFGRDGKNRTSLELLSTATTHGATAGGADDVPAGDQ